MAAVKLNKEDQVCPWHEEMEDAVREFRQAITDLRISGAKLAGGLILAQIVLIPVALALAKKMGIL